MYSVYFSKDDYMEALGKLHMTVTRAYKVRWQAATTLYSDWCIS